MLDRSAIENDTLLKNYFKSECVEEYALLYT